MSTDASSSARGQPALPPHCRNPLIRPNHGERVGIESGGHAALPRWFYNVTFNVGVGGARSGAFAEGIAVAGRDAV